MSDFILFAFSMVGLPLTSGFISKQFMVMALSESSYIALFGILFSSISSVIYIFRPVMYTISRTKKHIIDNNLSTITYTVIFPLALLNIMTFVIGFFWKHFV